MLPTAATNVYWRCSLTSKSGNHSCKRSLKGQVTSACCFQNSTASLTLSSFFWGQVKKYLWDHRDCTFETLKESIPRALGSVELRSICLWENQTHRWIDAFRTPSRDKRCSAEASAVQFNKI
ncbi:hypothetical protein K503DRAFT_474999 [Rhizopogon vinicolor AM-OR11-026]|uniref:Uncharacterized protein n=1 Tax=Rhizopogon vinicolor AM-OR11-026 TaxID=1314800 RepID=A0A1B7MN36_9AGAM|nr:hypothetical protein K503DRAFT_474999 [Rhizopogon vinicolor AM-OR11-026]